MTTKSLLVLHGKQAANEEVRHAVMDWRDNGHDLAVRVTWEAGDAERYVREALDLGYTTVIAGGGDGSENSPNQGPKTSRGQLTKEKVIKGQHFESGLGAEQDRTMVVKVDKNKVLANVLPGRRFSKHSDRKGYLYIDTWHIIGPWDAEPSRNRKINFNKSGIVS